MPINAAKVMTQTLADRGVRYAFQVPGESFLGLLDALADQPEIRLITTRHEGGAAFMAEAAGKLTGQPALCMGTRGVGSANLAIGIHTARQDSTPLLAFVGQVETPYRNREALQEMGLDAFLGQITKWAVEPADAESLPRITADAWRIATQGRPGPVAVALRGDILEEQIASSAPAPTRQPLSQPATADSDRAIDLLNRARRPLIIAGAEVLRANITDRLVTFAEHSGIPVATSFRRLDAFPLTHRLSAGSLSQFNAPELLTLLKTADVVWTMGARLDELTTLGYTLPAPGATLIQVDVDPNELGRSFPATLAIATSSREVLDQLAGKRNWPDWSDWANEIATIRQMGDTRSFALSRSPFANPAAVVQKLAQAFGAETTITVDAGNFSGWVQRFWPVHRPMSFLGPISGAMGYAVPAAVAAAVVQNDGKPVIAFAGDGGFMMTGNELATAAMYGLNVKCVVFDNSRYATIRLHQEREFPGRVSGTELWSPDLVDYARAFGGRGLRLETEAELDSTIEAFSRTEGIAVLQVIQDRNHIGVNRRLD